MIYFIADQAYGKTTESLSNFSNQYVTQYDNLIGRLLCNICGNRALLEMAEVAAQSEVGHKLMISFVNNTNRNN